MLERATLIVLLDYLRHRLGARSTVYSAHTTHARPSTHGAQLPCDSKSITRCLISIIICFCRFLSVGSCIDSTRTRPMARSISLFGHIGTPYPTFSVLSVAVYSRLGPGFGPHFCSGFFFYSLHLIFGPSNMIPPSPAACNSLKPRKTRE